MPEVLSRGMLVCMHAPPHPWVMQPACMSAHLAWFMASGSLLLAAPPTQLALHGGAA